MAHQLKLFEDWTKEAFEIVEALNWWHIGILEDAILGIHLRETRGV